MHVVLGKGKFESENGILEVEARLLMLSVSMCHIGNNSLGGFGECGELCSISVRFHFRNAQLYYWDSFGD